MPAEFNRWLTDQPFKSDYCADDIVTILNIVSSDKNLKGTIHRSDGTLHIYTQLRMKDSGLSTVSSKVFVKIIFDFNSYTMSRLISGTRKGMDAASDMFDNWVQDWIDDLTDKSIIT